MSLSSATYDRRADQDRDDVHDASRSLLREKAGRAARTRTGVLESKERMHVLHRRSVLGTTMVRAAPPPALSRRGVARGAAERRGRAVALRDRGQERAARGVAAGGGAVVVVLVVERAGPLVQRAVDEAVTRRRAERRHGQPLLVALEQHGVRRDAVLRVLRARRDDLRALVHGRLVRQPARVRLLVRRVLAPVGRVQQPQVLVLGLVVARARARGACAARVVRAAAVRPAAAALGVLALRARERVDRRADLDRRLPPPARPPGSSSRRGRRGIDRAAVGLAVEPRLPRLELAATCGSGRARGSARPWRCGPRRARRRAMVSSTTSCSAAARTSPGTTRPAAPLRRSSRRARAAPRRRGRRRRARPCRRPCRLRRARSPSSADE